MHIQIYVCASVKFFYLNDFTDFNFFFKLTLSPGSHLDVMIRFECKNSGTNGQALNKLSAPWITGQLIVTDEILMASR